jgi:trk system potassium uptake protein TrkA
MQGQRLGMELVRPNLLEQLRLDDRNSIEEIKVPGAFVGQSLRDLNLRKHYKVSVLAVGPKGQLQVNPQASHQLQADELLVVMGSNEALRSLPGCLLARLLLQPKHSWPGGPEAPDFASGF